jgi:neutral ceramidase
MVQRREYRKLLFTPLPTNTYAKSASAMAFSAGRSSAGFGLSRSSIYSLFSLVALFFLSTLAACGSAAATGDKYLIGVGKADITGPVVEIGFAGYANLDQVGSGLRQRLRSRAFIIADKDNPSDRFVYLILDTQSGDTATRYGVLDGLQKLGDEYKVYGHNNVALTGTHSHAGPGAWFNYLLPQVTSLGFDKQSYQALVDGAVLSIKRAHENLQEVCQRLDSVKFPLPDISRLHLHNS